MVVVEEAVGGLEELGDVASQFGIEFVTVTVP
jgi:hypothetical protein